MLAFAAHIGFALHQQISATIIAPGGGAFVKWYSNAQLFDGKLPSEFLNTLGPGRTLTQGRRDVGEQFSYAWAVGEDHQVVGYWATFRHSFAVMAFVSPMMSDFDVAPSAHLFRPGFLQGFSVRALKPAPWPGVYGQPFAGPYRMD